MATRETRLASLSPAERTVLDLLPTGMTNREIATALGKAPETVKRQVASVLRRLDVRSRTAAAALLVSLSNGAGSGEGDGRAGTAVRRAGR